MSTNRNKLIGLALVGACTFGVWKLGSALLSDQTQATKHAVNRLWIDHAPRNDRDMITHFVLLDHSQGKFGAIGRSSQWRHMIDVFRWQLSGSKLNLFFPQDEARGQVEIETWECAGEAPAPFDLCMKMTNKQGRSWTFYSREDWEIDPGDAQESLADIVDDEPSLAAVLGTLDESAAERLDAIDLEDTRDWVELRGLQP
ncbi:MAG TPA: hypothetical protein VK034_32405 [Enhygromyxa sp.]|nr:hypothetical protein [Enhygromyxa sp.]